MDIKQISERAVAVRQKYSAHRVERSGREWSRAELAQGFVGDVGDLMKLVMAKEGIREIENVDEKLEHELADCLWSILVLANEYEIDIEHAFTKTMDELDQRLS